ncbi:MULTISPECIES: symmetrical bis(5'-nucleosyl)-tetraphosphatase [unclassified Neptuniibacter]|uniref:symmetrical bis(5'-nucleosyl)-tetraphosphatase n=1 Tax=unclassified Neptuniibacter TaxID=2630693 RepID=UPI0025DEF115|nr:MULTISPECIES: symmetrical bis(5'-nucleosyl)-tetraphosphatase [unclassified Neptuniibacter]|tara:strand:- start:12072 stop:12923 length:852 start_codon:yes stop_codon:yes gene_type:complete
MATYAIGDIQGCYDELQALLKLVNFSEQDQLWVAGDLVNRGPKSLETLRFLKSLGPRATCVLGNHDLHLLAIYFQATKQKRSDTLAPIFSAPDRDELLSWLLQQKLMVHDKENRVAMIHAGIPPCWSIRKARKRAKEVENVLNSTLAKEYFAHMYGNKPDTWTPTLEGWDRLRLITNYLTRMRFCTPEGKLDFSAKGTLDSQPEGHKPWFRLPRKNPKEQNTRIIFGHWAALEGEADADNVFALDTGCVWGGKLTALRLEDMKTFSINAIQPKHTPPPTSQYL